MEKYTGETIPRNHVSKGQAGEIIKKATEAIAANPADQAQMVTTAVTEYKVSYGIRGDNVPERAAYLGYLNVRELYPDLKTNSFEEFVKALVEGSRKATVYAGRNLERLGTK